MSLVNPKLMKLKYQYKILETGKTGKGNTTDLPSYFEVVREKVFSSQYLAKDIHNLFIFDKNISSEIFLVTMRSRYSHY